MKALPYGAPTCQGATILQHRPTSCSKKKNASIAIALSGHVSLQHSAPHVLHWVCRGENAPRCPVGKAHGVQPPRDHKPQGLLAEMHPDRLSSVLADEKSVRGLRHVLGSELLHRLQGLRVSRMGFELLCVHILGRGAAPSTKIHGCLLPYWTFLNAQHRNMNLRSFVLQHSKEAVPNL